MITYASIRPQLDWLCDAMIPGDAALGLPAASAVGVADQMLPMALKTRADLAPLFLAIIARFPAPRPADPLAWVAALSGEDRALLGRFIAGAYFAHPQVMKALGYPGFEALHITPDYDEIVAAVQPVMARGPCYRAI